MHLSASLGTVIDDERDERRRDASTHPPRSPFTPLECKAAHSFECAASPFIEMW